ERRLLQLLLERTQLGGDRRRVARRCLDLDDGAGDGRLLGVRRGGGHDDHAERERGGDQERARLHMPSSTSSGVTQMTAVSVPPSSSSIVNTVPVPPLTSSDSTSGGVATSTTGSGVVLPPPLPFGVTAGPLAGTSTVT